MSQIIFAQRSKGAVTLEDFKPLVEPEVIVEPKIKPDLTFRAGNFTIKPSFTEGQQEWQGWNVGIDPESNSVYLFRNTDQEFSKRMKFLKGDKPFAKFKSESLELAIKNSGLNIDGAFSLIRTDLEGLPGLESFKVVSAETSAPIVEEIEVSSFEPEVVNQQPPFAEENISVEVVEELNV